MPARLTFLAIAAFWLTMNVLLWRAEYGAHSGETPVPLELVWRKILTAPDASSLSVYQNHERTGYCEFSTSVGQQMATVDADTPPPEGLAQRAGYQIHLSGNVALNDFTNRLKFAGRVQFATVSAWQEVNLKISSRLTSVEIHALATNQTVHLKINSEGAILEREVTFADLKNPDSLARALLGNGADLLLGMVDLPDLAQTAAAQKLDWHASRTRVKIGTESVPVYRIETSLLGRAVLMDVSTLGEILRVELPANISARIDGWSKP
jgi:hypothetical protein